MTRSRFCRVVTLLSLVLWCGGIGAESVDEPQSPLEKEVLLCELCETILAPAIVETVRRSEERHNAADTMDRLVEEMIAESESHVHTDLFREYLSHLMWSSTTMRKLSALQKVYHRFPERSHHLERLVDHVICACRAHEWEQSRAFERFLSAHATAVAREVRDHADRDALPGDDDDAHDRAVGENGLFPLRNPEAEPMANFPTLGGDMPGFGGLSTGQERQGGDL